MRPFAAIAARLARGRRMQAYRAARRELDALSAADLADIGLKRYQLGHVARLRAFT